MKGQRMPGPMKSNGAWPTIARVISRRSLGRRSVRGFTVVLDESAAAFLLPTSSRTTSLMWQQFRTISNVQVIGGGGCPVEWHSEKVSPKSLLIHPPVDAAFAA